MENCGSFCAPKTQPPSTENARTSLLYSARKEQPLLLVGFVRTLAHTPHPSTSRNGSTLFDSRPRSSCPPLLWSWINLLWSWTKFHGGRGAFRERCVSVREVWRCLLLPSIYLSLYLSVSLLVSLLPSLSAVSMVLREVGCFRNSPGNTSDRSTGGVAGGSSDMVVRNSSSDGCELKGHTGVDRCSSFHTKIKRYPVFE